MARRKQNGEVWMAEEEYITRREYEEHEARVQDENNRQNHRIDELEKGQATINRLATSVEVMANNMGHMADAQKQSNIKIDDISSRVKTIEEAPARSWTNARRTAFNSIIGAICGAAGVAIIEMIARYIR